MRNHESLERLSARAIRAGADAPGTGWRRCCGSA